MKRLPLTVTFLALTAFAVGCKPSGEKSTSQQEVTAKAKEAAQTNE